MIIFDDINKNKIDFSGSIEYILIGLGNPGNKYINTRHNAGFLAIDYIAKKHGILINKKKFNALCESTLINSKKILLIKPQQFMNNSGQSIVEAMKFYKIPSNKIIVILDDINLDVGTIRIRRKGSAGGHNGLKNIIDLSKKDDFIRIKIGIGSKPNISYNLADWVLSDFSEKEMNILKSSITNTLKSINLIVSGNIERAMNKYN